MNHLLVLFMEGELEVVGLIGSDRPIAIAGRFLFMGAESPLERDSLKVVLDLLVGFHGKGEIFRVLGFGKLENLDSGEALGAKISLDGVEKLVAVVGIIFIDEDGDVGPDTGEELDGEEFEELGHFRRHEFSDKRADEDDGGHHRA